MNSDLPCPRWPDLNPLPFPQQWPRMLWKEKNKFCHTLSQCLHHNSSHLASGSLYEAQLRVLFDIYFNPHNSIIRPLELEIAILKFREVLWPAQGHTDSKWKKQAWNPGLVQRLKPVLLATHCVASMGYRDRPLIQAHSRGLWLSHFL